MSNRNPSKIRKFSAPLWIGLASVAVISLVVFATPWQQFGKQPSSNPQVKPTITDPLTTLDIPFVEKSQVNDSMRVLTYKKDSMYRDQPLYDVHPIVIDTQYYQSREPKRGDVVFFNDKLGIRAHIGHPLGETVGRIVGLPGESVEIRVGQVYIDDKKLDTFYGHYQHMNDTNNPEAMMPVVQIPSDHYFIMFDDWFRGGMLNGATSKSDIIGNVIGYLKE